MRFNLGTGSGLHAKRCASVLAALMAVAFVSLAFSEDAEEPTDSDPPTGSIVVDVAQLRKLDSSCPEPTVKQGSQCVLTGDITISQTLSIAPFTHLNCQGHRILAATPGTMDSTGNATPSEPRIAILGLGSQGVKIQNCFIGDDKGTPDDITDDALFQNAIVLLDSKIPATWDPNAPGYPGALALSRNKVLGNHIYSSLVGILGIGIDNTEIKDNTLGFGGIWVYRNSAHISIVHNAIKAPLFAAGTYVPRFPPGAATSVPGLSLDTPYVPASFQASIAILAANMTSLINIVSNAQLLAQFPLDASNRLSDITIDGNTIEQKTGSRIEPIRIQYLEDSTISNNVIHIAGTSSANASVSGITAFSQVSTSKVTIPGKCTLNTARYCVTKADCDLAPIQEGGNGDCAGTSAVDFYASDNVVFENNFIDGDLSTGGNQSAGIVCINETNARIEGNTIIGRGRGTGIRLDSKNALETAIVMRNYVSNVSFGLHLRQANNAPNLAAFFGAHVSLNDITGSTTRAIRADLPDGTSFPFKAELSDMSRGNHWGRSCADSDGFRDFNEPDANGKKDSPSSLVTDSHPYGFPVANVFDETFLNQVCK